MCNIYLCVWSQELWQQITEGHAVNFPSDYVRAASKYKLIKFERFSHSLLLVKVETKNALEKYSWFYVRAQTCTAKTV